MRGISASGLRGISASGLRGISASGLRGISASGLRGISASGLRGISASGLRGISASGLRAESTTNEHLAFQFEEIPLVAIGAIANTAAKEGFVTVLGQEVVIDSHTLTIAVDDETGLPTKSIGLDGIRQVQDGDYVVVAGELIEPGRQLATIIIKIPMRFEANDSIVYLRSKFSKDSAKEGNGYAGNSSVDFSGTLYNPTLATTSSDDAIEYFGFTTSDKPNRLIATFGDVVNEEF